MGVSRLGRCAGYAAAGLAFASAAVNLYWGLGGTLGLQTVGAQAVELSRSGELWVFALLWFVATVKATGGLLALTLVRPVWSRRFRRWMLLLAGWGAPALLLLYGAANLVMQLAVKSGAIQVPPGFDWAGFYGHLYLWTPALPGLGRAARSDRFVLHQEHQPPEPRRGHAGRSARWAALVDGSGAAWPGGA